MRPYTDEECALATHHLDLTSDWDPTRLEQDQ
jgi:hypothetical protein